MMRFTWDPEKNAINVRRHGIALQDATRIFDGPTVERTDDRFEYGEIRVYAIGLVNGVEITVIYTDRDNDQRHLIFGMEGRTA
ncbi:MAG TPA: BrnT family toxin [Stellaceae bacterium]|nr:BrnT family toxin [Stellaceae bacterium]